MNLKRFFLFSFIFLTIFAQAEEIKIKSFSEKWEPMTVGMQRKDNNGEICPLIKVVLPSDQAGFEGNIVGNCDYKISEYWCYLTPGSKYLKVKYPGYEPLMVDFVSLAGKGLESKHIYELILSVSTTSSSDAILPKDNKINGHEYVDLGLPSGLKWATCNVGASCPEEYGQYFAWGETEQKAEFMNANCLTLDREFGDIGGNPKYDVARAKWGGSWRLPTKDEWEELLNQCTWRFVTIGDNNGYKVKGPNGKEIFLPAAQMVKGSYLMGSNHELYYWSSTPDEFTNAYQLFISGNDRRVLSDLRKLGESVRPVSE